MYRYLVFGFDSFYPAGGMYDIREKYTDVNDVVKFIKSWIASEDFDEYDNIHVYDTKTDGMVYVAERHSTTGDSIKDVTWNHVINVNKIN